MAKPPRRLGWIGFGRFGRFAVAELREHFEVLVHDIDDPGEAAAELGARSASLAAAAAAPYVVLAVPLQQIEAVLRDVRDHVAPGSLVVDVGSVKSVPLRQMERLLPDGVEYLGTHPAFGPESGQPGGARRTIILCPGRTDRLEEVRSFLEQEMGLRVLVTDAETHDREIALTQGVAQFVGRAVASLAESDSPIRTAAYDHLLEVSRMVGEDTWDLFAAIQNLNPYAAAVRSELVEVITRLEERLADDPTARTRASAEGD